MTVLNDWEFLKLETETFSEIIPLNEFIHEILISYDFKFSNIQKQFHLDIQRAVTFWNGDNICNDSDLLYGIIFNSNSTLFIKKLLLSMLTQASLASPLQLFYNKYNKILYNNSNCNNAFILCETNNSEDNITFKIDFITNNYNANNSIMIIKKLQLKHYDNDNIIDGSFVNIIVHIPISDNLNSENVLITYIVEQL